VCSERTRAGILLWARFAAITPGSGIAIDSKAGSFDSVDARFASANFAQDDSFEMNHEHRAIWRHV
jgi:hypothetical protein